ncbi:MAG: hypothetical protein JNG88_17710, partial [Phycisphaerales bacterium]|nr:hypothetical protein [Phycisphaerales bacterium]
MRVFGELGSFFLRNSVACWALRALPLVTLVVGCLPIGSAGRNNNLPADEPVSDDYLLPFPPGVPRFCGQSNFGVAGLGSHATEYAIDFVMPDDSP